MNILSLDLGTNTGWAVLRDGVKNNGSMSFTPKRGESPGMRFLRFSAWLSEICGLIGDVGLIVYEMPHNRGGAATHIAHGLVAEVEKWQAQHPNAQITSCHSATLKKWATGKGNATKDQMLAEASERGWTVNNDDEADAALMLEWVIDRFQLDSNT